MKTNLNPSLQWLPEMRDNHGKSCLKEVDAMKRIIEINQEWFKKKERRDVNKRV
jgi:hypothetical protein